MNPMVYLCSILSNVLQYSHVSMSHVKMFLMFRLFVHFAGEREQMLKEMCTALLEADVNMKLVGCLSRMSGERHNLHTHHHTHS